MVGCWRCHHRSSWHRTQQQDSFKLLSCLFCHGPWSFCGILSRPVNDCSWWIRCGGKYNVLASRVNVVPRHQQVSGSGRRNKRVPIWAIVKHREREGHRLNSGSHSKVIYILYIVNYQYLFPWSFTLNLVATHHHHPPPASLNKWLDEQVRGQVRLVKVKGGV